MAERLDAIYTRWSFTDSETPLAQCFTDLQVKHLQNELALVAEERARTAFDPYKPYETFGTLEFLRGKLEAIQYLLTVHEHTKEQLREMLREKTANQTE